MNETTTLIEKIIEGIQEKKGKQIVVADLNEIEDTIEERLDEEENQYTNLE